MSLLAELPATAADNRCNLLPRRAIIYALALAMLASIFFFVNLGGPPMYVDEAQYALCAEHSRQTGDWLTYSPYPPEPYFQKPPLYFWLTRLTYPLFGEGVVRYRFWSALFGVGCVSLTGILGALLIGSEAGFLGGLLLLTNRYFQSDHGARTGSMDTAVTFFALCAFIFYWLLREERIGRAGWVGIGVAVGLASLFKQAAGAPVLAVLALHALLADRQAWPATKALRGILWATLIGIVVASPYYLLVWHRAGGHAFTEMFTDAIVNTALKGDPSTHEHMFRGVYDDPQVAIRFAGQPWHYLLGEMHHSSPAFLLSGAAIIFAIVSWFRGRRTGVYSLLSIGSLLYLLVFSCSVVKRVRYLYPAFPLVALAMAGGCLALIGALTAAWRKTETGAQEKSAAEASAFAAICIALVFVESIRFTFNAVYRGRPNFEAYNNYQVFHPAIAEGRARVVFYGFPATQFEWRKQMGLDAAECFYLEQMRDSLHISNPAELTALLADERPTFLLESRFADTREVDDALQIPARADARYVYQHRAFLFRGIDLAPLLKPHLSPEHASKDIQLLDGQRRPLDSANGGFAFTDRLIVRIAPPLKADAWLTVCLARSNDELDGDVRFHAFFKDALLNWDRLGKLSTNPKIAVKIEHGRWAKSGSNDIEIELLPAERSQQPRKVSARVTQAWLSLYPEPMADR